MKLNMFNSWKKNKDLFKFFFNYQRKYSSLAITIGILMCINVCLSLPIPLVTMYIIDVVLSSGNLSVLNYIFLILLGVVVMGPLSGYLYRYITYIFNASVHFDLERDLYGHVQRLPMNYFARRPSGYILTRIGEISSVEAVMANTFFSVIKDILQLIVCTFIILNLNFILGGIAVLSLPLFVASIKAFHGKLKAINIILREERAQYAGKLERNINSVEKIKSSVKEESVLFRLTEKLTSVIRINIKAQLISAFAGIVSSFVGAAAPFIISWYGLALVMQDQLTLGQFFAITSYIGYLLGPARNLTSYGYSISQAMAGLERIYELFREKEELSGGLEIAEINEIEFKDVNYSYEAEKQVLKDLNLTIRKGDRIALVGQSGQGKSTLTKMIMKFFEPDNGTLRISGIDSGEINIKSLRSKIAYISQRQRILEDEVKEQMTDPIVRSLLEKFKILKKIDNENIHQTEFSGGEVQKLELIESMVKDADVLIVDEGTSNIDYRSEKIVMEEMFSRYKDKIIIFIAHRLSSITDFPRILVMDNGQVAEDGTHNELIDIPDGKYGYLWGKQLQNQNGIPMEAVLQMQTGA